MGTSRSRLERLLVRRVIPLILTVGLAASLVACSTGTPAAADCTPVASGKASDAVTATGDFNSKPDVTIEFPTAVEKTERSVLIAGDGEVAQPGDTVMINFSLYSGETGEELSATEYGDDTATDFPLDDTQLLPGIVRTLECSTIGSRVVGVIPPADSFGDQGSQQLGVQPGEDIVFVADIVAMAPPVEPALPRANGVDQPVEPGFPTVELDADGRPTVTFPDSAIPTEFMLTVLKLGDGPTVADGDDVVVHYEGINWNTGVIFDESWARGEPATFNTSQVIPGFTQALVGQQVGSQVLVVIPPDLGYGPAGGSPPNIGATDTIVFVIDILGIA